MIREDFLQQGAYSDTDSFCPVEKQYLMLRVIMTYFEHVNIAMGRGVTLRQVQALPIRAGIGRMKDVQDIEAIRNMAPDIEQQLLNLVVEK